ncbi:ribosomal RNA small subunit methyltransferase C [Escherichia coli]|uniref:Ribosomal RNA small subunit methyltransferase C n=1 Tax=Escherichia coli TaxID=562 RepID=A0A3S4LH88_ECOLX|nr:ribosomal RNA small subunit methyltransferase C [Escherichia coli]
MSAFTPASEVLLRHSDDFEQSRILFAGDLQDDLPARLDTAASRAHTQQFHHWQVLSRQMGITPVLVWSPRRMTSQIAIR